MSRLVVVEGPDKGNHFELSAENTLGSAAQNAIVLQDKSLSDHHVRIFQDNESQWFIVCLEDGKQVEVNYEPCSHSPLQNGDIISAGSSVLMFVGEEEEGGEEDSSGSIEARIKTYEDEQSVIDSLTQTKQPQKHLTTLYKISNLLGQIYEFDKLSQQILKILFEEFPIDRGCILLRTPEGEFENLASRTRLGPTAEDLRLSQTILGEVVDTKEAILAKDAFHDQRFQGGGSIVELNIRSVICIPLIRGDEILGALYIDSSQKSGAFSEDDLKLLTAIGLQAANVIEKTRLQQVKIEKEKLESEMRVAERVQQFLMPREIFQPVGLDISAKYVLSQGLGGDYYDVIPLAEDRTAIVVADVSGHSISSALVMCMCRSVIRQLCSESDSPAEILHRTNQVLVEDMISGMFITVFLGIFDPGGFDITYSAAGHPYPIYFTDQGEVYELDKGGLPLGILKSARYPEGHISLSQNEGIFLFTDGLTEMKSPQGKWFGVANLKEAVRRRRELSSQGLVENIFQAANNFSGAAPLKDDVTILALKVAENFTRHQLGIQSEMSEVEPGIQQILDLIQPKGFGLKKEDHLRLVLREALVNAVVHGNQSNSEKKVSILLHIGDERCYVRIRDQGTGFDTSKVVDDFKWVAPQAQSHGRGVLLIRQYVDRIQFNRKGNEIYLEFNNSTF